MAAILQRVILIVLDSLGIGATPDAGDYGDVGSNTLGHIARAVGGLPLPNLARLGLAHLTHIAGQPPCSSPVGRFIRLRPQSAGKDTTTGHWELAGWVTERPFPTYPNGFPDEVIHSFEQAVGCSVLGNEPASGTEIIQRLGELHQQTRRPIVYTSADSVFQIAAHEDVIPVDDLYAMCRAARRLLTGEHAVARVIARPFAGSPGDYRRTSRRHDFSLPPPGPTVLDSLQQARRCVVGIGKIHDIFAGRGIEASFPTTDNDDGQTQLLRVVADAPADMVFVNLVDFDSRYGHRNDPRGYAEALIRFDSWLPLLLDQLRRRDLLLITADHGNDPTTISTDHSREFTPLLMVSPALPTGRRLPDSPTLADVAATVSDWLGVRWSGPGRSLLESS